MCASCVLPSVASLTGRSVHFCKLSKRKILFWWIKYAHFCLFPSSERGFNEPKVNANIIKESMQYIHGILCENRSPLGLGEGTQSQKEMSDCIVHMKWSIIFIWLSYDGACQNAQSYRCPDSKVQVCQEQCSYLFIFHSFFVRLVLLQTGHSLN